MGRFNLVTTLFWASGLLLAQPEKPLSGLNLKGFNQVSDGVQDTWENNPFAKQAGIRLLRKPKVSMIVYHKNRSAALLNNQAVQPGEKIGEYEVVAIRPGQVVLRSPNGLTRLQIPGAKRKNQSDYSIHVNNAPLEEAIKLLAMMMNKNVVMPESLDMPVSASFPHISLEDAVNALLRSRGLAQHDRSGVMHILTRQQHEALGGDLRTKTFALKYAKAAELQPQAAKLVSPRGTVMVDSRTNTVTVRDTPNYLNNMNQFISNVDFADRQVLIEARIVEASTSFAENFGIQWGAHLDTSSFKMDGVRPQTTNMAGVTGAAAGGANAVPLPVGLTGGNYVQSPGVASPLAALAIGVPFLNGGLDIQLSAAEENDEVSVLSRPSIITTNNQPATISNGKTRYVRTATTLGVSSQTGGLQSVGGVQGITAGISMTVTPQITVDGKIRLSINVTSSQMNEARTLDGIPEIIDNNAATQVLLNNGETTVLGGLYQANGSKTSAGLPLLSRIPFIGGLFGKKTKAKSKRELLVFIKPVIIDKPLKQLDRSEKEPPTNIFDPELKLSIPAEPAV